MSNKLYKLKELYRQLDRLPFFKKRLRIVLGIIRGDVHLMEKKKFWVLHRVIQDIHFEIRHLLRNKFNWPASSTENNTIILDPKGIRYVALKGSCIQTKLPIQKGDWDKKKKDLVQTDNPESLNRDSINEKIEVAIDREGKFILIKGYKHLMLSLSTGLDKITVEVKKRHFKWAKFRRELCSYSLLYQKGTYQPLLHPDLQSFHSHRKTDDRWNLIENQIQLNHGTVLDIGSNLGYFCHKFEERGFNCFAVEQNNRYLYFLKNLKISDDKKFVVVPRSIYDIDQKKYDIVLAFSIFHHFLKTKNLFDKMTSLLGSLDMKMMFFEPHESGHGFKNSYKTFNEIEFVNYIIENSCLTKYRFLGRGERGRPLYVLYSDLMLEQ